MESPVAQWLEHPTRSRRVVGSNPIWSSDFFPSFHLMLKNLIMLLFQRPSFSKVPNKLVNQWILVKYQTLNIKNDNLSFEEYFLFFANFSHLTVKFQITFQRGVSPTCGYFQIASTFPFILSRKVGQLYRETPLFYLALGLLIAPPTYSLHLSPLSDPLEQARRVASLHSFIYFNQLFPETFCIL